MACAALAGNVKDICKAEANSFITTKIRTELAGEKLSSLIHIKVDTDKQGMVTLSGSARNQTAIDKAVSIAKGVKGVTSVRNNIEIKADL